MEQGNLSELFSLANELNLCRLTWNGDVLLAQEYGGKLLTSRNSKDIAEVEVLLDGFPPFRFEFFA
jgi:hypothetical protein